MEQMLIIAGGVALGGLAVIYRKPLAVGLLGLAGFAILLILGLWAANTFTEPVIQYLIAMGWPDARVDLGVIWSMIALLTPLFVFYCVLQLIEEIRPAFVANIRAIILGLVGIVACVGVVHIVGPQVVRSRR